MKAILAVASSHLFSTDRHHHYSQTSSPGQGASLCSTFRSQTNCSASSTARFEKESTTHPSMCESLCQALTALAHNGCGDLSPRASRHRSALCRLQLSPWLLPLPKSPLCHSDRTITTLLPYDRRADSRTDLGSSFPTAGPPRATLAAPAGSQLHCQPARALLSVRLPEADLTVKESPRFESLIGTRQAQGLNSGLNSNNLWRKRPILASSGGEPLGSQFDTGSARSPVHDDSDLRAREEGASSALLSLSAQRHAGHQRHNSPSLELSSPSQPGSLRVSSSDLSYHSPFLPASSSRAPTSPYDHPVLPLPPSSYAGVTHASRHHHDRHHRNLRSLVAPYPSPFSHVSGRRTVSPPNALRSGGTGSVTGKGAGETAGGKKRRARATPEQLEILNQVYARTPFPSTQERIDLAATLGMTPRSVQIWYVMISFIATVSLGGASWTHLGLILFD